MALEFDQSDAGGSWDFTSTIYDGSQTGPVTASIDDAERVNANLADPVKAPTSTPLKMSQIADNLVALHGTKDAANRELLDRAITVGNKVMAFDVDQLKSDAIKDRMQLYQRTIATVGKTDGVYAHFMWGQDISLPGYTGTVLQIFDVETKAWEKGAANPVVTNRSQIEAFYLKNGATNMDLQSTRRVMNIGAADRIEQTIKVTLAAGTYQAVGADKFSGVQQFTILEKMHDGPLKGKYQLAGATTEFTVKLTIDNKGAITFDGPWNKK